MADLEEATTPMDMDNSSGSDSSSDEQTAPQIEWLATSRAKRSTAGTRMTSLIQQEAEDDELELLFAEDENDEGFEMDGGDDSDVQMDSSDDDDDNGPPAPGAEELDGEKELQRKERAERLGKKRKNDHLPKAFQAKRVKIDPTAPKRTPPRPKKKSERSSWIPTLDDAPVRVSHRSTTMDAKERLYKEMEERERKRLKQLENMEKAAARKAAEKKPEKTQEDRLAEAARIEKANAKSLNRWEEAERIREEEARARLEALHNRKMEGPVITWWSGKAIYVGDKLKQVGKNVTVEEAPVKVPRKKRPSEMGIGNSATAQARLERQASLPKTAIPPIAQPSAPSSGPGTPIMPASIHGSVAVQGAPPQNPQPHLQAMQATPAMLNGSAPLSGLSAPPSAPASPIPQPQPSAPSGPSPSPAAASQLPTPPPPPPPPSASAISLTPTTQNVAPMAITPLAPPPSTTSSVPNAIPQTPLQPFNLEPSPNLAFHAASNTFPAVPAPAAQPSAGPMPPSQTSSINVGVSNGPSPSPFNLSETAPQPNPVAPSPQIKSEPPPSMPPPSAQNTFLGPHQTSQLSIPPPRGTHASNSAPPAPNIPPAYPQPITHATSNRLILSSFHEPSLRDKSILTAILFHGNRFTKLPRPATPPVCAITGLPAKFKDPKTGLPYVNSYAFKEIRRLERGEYRWSALLGAYVGGVNRTVGTGQAAVVVPGAARGVPGRFVDPKATPPPKAVKLEVKPVTTPIPGTLTGGAMPPPPVPHMPATPTSMGANGAKAPIMTPGQFAAQNSAQRMAPVVPVQNPSPVTKQPSPFNAKSNNSASPVIMQPLSSVAAPMKAASPAVSAPPPPPPPTPVAEAAASVASVAVVAPDVPTVPSPAQSTA